MPRGIYPIGFSIPACKIVDAVPPKTREVSPLIPGDPSTYIYNTEEEQQQQQRDSRTAHTWKKAGWDCMRHQEILANGCIPLFRDLDKCPPRTMTFYPKQGGTAEELLAHTRKYLTTKAMAQYVLDTVGVSNPSRVLQLAPHPWADYLRDLTLHGLKEILGTECHEYPRVPFLQTDQAGGPLYGKGFSYTKLLDPALRKDAQDATLAEDLKTGKYDLVIQGSVHRGMPALPAGFPTERVVGLCGEDEHRCEFLRTFPGHLFVRELTYDAASSFGRRA